MDAGANYATTDADVARAGVVNVVKPRPMTADVVCVAATAGLMVVRANNETGFRCMFYAKRNNRYLVKPRHDGKLRSVGYFSAPDEAALRVARSLTHLNERNRLDRVGNRRHLVFVTQWPDWPDKIYHLQRAHTSRSFVVFGYAQWSSKHWLLYG